MAFWKKFYKSKYTGAEIDAAVAKAGDATKVTANPTLAGTESALEGLQVGNTKYKVGGGITILDFNLTCSINYSNSELSAQIINELFPADNWTALMAAVENGPVWLKVILSAGTGVDSVPTSYTYIIINGFIPDAINPTVKLPEIAMFTVGVIGVGSDYYLGTPFIATQFNFDDRHGLTADFISLK